MRQRPSDGSASPELVLESRTVETAKESSTPSQTNHGTDACPYQHSEASRCTNPQRTARRRPAGSVVPVTGVSGEHGVERSTIDPATSRALPELPTSVGRQAAISVTFVPLPNSLTAARPHGPLRLAEPDRNLRPLFAPGPPCRVWRRHGRDARLAHTQTRSRRPRPRAGRPAFGSWTAGLDFLVWAWDPVESATGYEGHAFPDGTPLSERPPLQITVDPAFRADGLEPGTVMMFFVRAIRETAGGRAVGPWSNPGTGETLTPPSPPMTVDRDRAGQWRARFRCGGCGSARPESRHRGRGR